MKSKAKRRKSIAAGKIRLRRIIIFVFVLALTAAVCLFTPVFNVTDISVEGNRAVSSEEIIKAAAIKNGTNIFKINTAKAVKSVCRIGYVEKAEIKRRFPRKIVIKVSECTEKAYILYAASYVGIDTKGKVLSVKKVSEVQEGITTVTGISLKAFKVGEEFVPAKKDKKQVLVDIFEASEKQNLTGSIKNINLSDTSDIKLTLDSGTGVVLGKNEQLEYKLAYLKEVIKSFDDKTRGGTVDLSDTSNVVYKGGD